MAGIGGGVDNSGYLSVTDNLNGQIGAIIFPDFENGAVVTAFSITAQLACGRRNIAAC